MRKTLVAFIVITLILSSTMVFAQTNNSQPKYKDNAVASYYAEKYHGCITANGEVFDMNAFTAAHKTLPFNTILKVTNLANGKTVTVRINDRGPFIEGREIDLSKAAAIALDMTSTGTANVSIEVISMPEGTTTAPSETATFTTTEVQSDTTPITATATTVIAASAPETKNTEDSVKTSNTLEASEYTGPLWRIQIGAYAAEANAYNLVKKLRAANFSPAYEKNGNIIRVVLANIRDDQRIETENALKKAGFTDYLVRRER